MADKIKIDNLQSLKDLVQQVKTLKENKQYQTKIGNDSVSFPEHGQDATTDMLNKGFKLLKTLQQNSDSSKLYEDELENFGGFYPAMPSEGVGESWFSSFVSQHLGAKLEPNGIVWNLNDGKYLLDCDLNLTKI